MASDEFGAAASDKQYVRVYPLNMKEYDIYAGGSEEPENGQVEKLPETGNEQYFVINKDGSGEIIAADPVKMRSEFQGNIADLSVSALDGRFKALQESFFENGHLMSPPYEGSSPENITADMMLNSLANIQSEVDAISANRLQVEGQMIVPDTETQGILDTSAAKLSELSGMISEAETVAPLVEHSYQLINQLEGSSADNTLTSQQYDQLHENVFGVEPSEQHQIPSYARG